MQFKLEKIKLDLRVNWKLSRNETLFKENFIFQIIEGGEAYKGEVAPNIRYGETPQRIEDDFQKFQEIFKEEKELETILYKNNFSHSFQFAVESAFIHRQALKEGLGVAEYFSLETPQAVETSFTVPIMEEKELDDYLKAIKRFKYIKIKVNEENAVSFVKTIAQKSQALLRVDGNEAWKDFDAYKKFEQEIKKYPIQFIEQPFAAFMQDEYKELKKTSAFEIIADESIEQEIDFDLIVEQFHGINVKLMKAGGYQKALSLLKEAKKRNLKTMLGCMIETSLGISCALNLSSLADYYDLDGSLLIKNDPFNYIQESNGSLCLR